MIDFPGHADTARLILVGILVWGSFLSRSATAQTTIVEENDARISSTLGCADLLLVHKFRGDCCSMSDSESGGCELTVLSGNCLVSGPVWFLNFTSTSTTSSCPVGDFNPLGISGTTTPTPELTIAPTTLSPVDSETTTLLPTTTISAPTKDPTSPPTIMLAPGYSETKTLLPTTTISAPTKVPTSLPTMMFAPGDSENTTLVPTTTTFTPSSSPPGETDSPSSLPSSLLVAQCASDNDCPEQFCGVDGTCHDHTCEEFYLYHPVIEYDTERSSELECKEGTSQVHLINFGCAAAVGRMIPPSLGVGELPNQLCTGQTTVETEEEQDIIYFECYSFSKDTNFSDFEERAAAASDLQCPEALPVFYYSAGYTFSEIVDGSFQSSTRILAGPMPTNDFDEERAAVSTFSAVTRQGITQSPTITPIPTEQPTRDPDNPSSEATTRGDRWRCLFPAAASACALLMILQ